MEIIERKVKPERDAQKDPRAKEKWWLFIRPRPELRDAASGLERVLVVPLITNKILFTFLGAGTVYSHKLAVFALSQFASLSALQSNVHEIWGRFFSSTMKDDVNYSPSDCFETFPFPRGWDSNPALEAVGKEYYEFRAALMVRNNEGLTKTYNRFHDPEESSPDILRLRDLHEAMDRAVLDAYGWTHIPTACEFLLDYDDEEEEEDDPNLFPASPLHPKEGEAAPAGGGGSLGRAPGSALRRPRKKPWRYRWPDEIRDKVLAKLLDLNRERAAAEGQTALAKTPTRTTKAQGSPKIQGGLPGTEG